jgi:hypothetical protein
MKSIVAVLVLLLFSGRTLAEFQVEFRQQDINGQPVFVDTLGSTERSSDVFVEVWILGSDPVS